jgi:hypothetical protein
VTIFTSIIYYLPEMEQAQLALQNGKLAFNANGQLDAKSQLLVQAIGEGIGNTSAHEIGHTFSALPGMHDGTRDTYNGITCDGEHYPENFTGSLNGTQIHWESAADTYLKKAYGSSR